MDDNNIHIINHLTEDGQASGQIADAMALVHIAVHRLVFRCHSMVGSGVSLAGLKTRCLWSLSGLA